MSLYGAHWKVDGVPAAFITRGGRNGQYRVLFEREFGELADIEGINWAQPTLEHLAEGAEQGLPEGYGFTVEDISYSHANRSYTVTLRTARQYLGDVTGYQEQIQTLQGQAAETRAQAEEAQAALADQETALAAAYTEGVESRG